MGARSKVVILDDREGVLGASDAYAALDADVVAHREPLNGDALQQAVAGATVVVPIRERTPLDRATLDLLANVELVAQTGGHAYHVDLDAASQLGIVVALGRDPHGPLRPPTSVIPELVFGALLGLERRIVAGDAAMRAGEWPTLLGRGLAGRTLGILGLGRHGRAVAQVAAAFGLHVLAWGPTLTDERADAVGAQRAELDQLLQCSDIVSVHLRLSETSRGLLGAAELDQLPTGAVLVNTARGPIIDEAALVERLRDGRLAGAALDVFDQEPLPPEHPLRALPNVVLTPHIGWTVDRQLEWFAAVTAEQIARYLAHDLDPTQVLNPVALGHPRRRRGGIRSG